MMDDKKILTSRVTLNNYDLMIMDLDYVKRMVKDRIIQGLANEIDKKVELIERPNFELHAKEFEARVVVMTMEEYRSHHKELESLKEEIERLRKYEEAAQQFVEEIDDLDFGSYEMDDDDF